MIASLLTFGGCVSSDSRLVIFVLLDAARADRFGSHGSSHGLTPRMDQLAQRGAVFSRHFAHDTTTRATLPMMLYSRYFAPPLFPHSSRIPLTSPSELWMGHDRESISLPGALRRAGFLTAAISAHSWLRSGSAFAEEFDELHDLSTELDYPEKYPYPRAATVVDYVMGWLDARPESDVFLYIHLMDTHFPHYFEEDARALADDPELEARTATRFASTGQPLDKDHALEGDDRAFLDALYNGSLRYTDRHLGRLFDHLEERDELDHTLIVITADHGENLLEVDGRFDHSGPWFDTVAQVPLIVHYPGAIEVVSVREMTGAIDVAPTILDLLDVEFPEGKRFDGESLVPVANEGRPTGGQVFSRWGVRSGEYKLLLVGERQNDVLEALLKEDLLSIEGLGGQIYDVVRDPLETENLWPTHLQGVGGTLLDLWRRRLAPPYRRFLAARAPRPESSFAIAARDFEIGGDPEIREVGPGTQNTLDPRLAVWQRDRFWTDYGLYAPPETPQVQISFPLPNGAYLLTAAFQGTCHLRAGDGPLVTLSAPLEGPLPAGSLGAFFAASSSYGPVRVLDERFRGLLSPGDSEPCLLRYFGFEPSDDEPSEPVDQSEYESRLEALGYVN